MLSIQIAKHAFKKEVFTCFGSLPEILESLEKGEKCSKWLQANWLGVLFLRFLNKFFSKINWIFHVLGKNTIRFHLSPWYFSPFGTLRKIRYATVVLIVLYVACLICFLKFQQFGGHNYIFRKSRGKLKKSSLKSDLTPNFQHWTFFHLKSQQWEIWQYQCTTVLLWFKDRPN